MNIAIDRLRVAIARADSASGLLEPIALDDARALVARLDALLDDFQDCHECDGTGIGPVYVDGHGNVGDEPCSACAGLGGVQKSAAGWITKWHERTNEWRSRATKAESDLARLLADRDALAAQAHDPSADVVEAVARAIDNASTLDWGPRGDDGSAMFYRPEALAVLAALTPILLARLTGEEATKAIRAVGGMPPDSDLRTCLATLAAHAAEREGWEAQIVGLRAELKHVESVAPVGPGRAADRLVGEIARLRAALEEVRGTARRRLVPECIHGVTIARECAECDSGSAVGYASAVAERNVAERLWSDAEARLESLRPTYESAISARRAWTPTRDAHDRIERTAGYLVDEVGKALALAPAAPTPVSNGKRCRVCLWPYGPEMARTNECGCSTPPALENW